MNTASTKVMDLKDDHDCSIRTAGLYRCPAAN